MPDQKPAANEFKHIKCATDDVQAVINQHQMFYWEVTGTNTVVSKESHLESGMFTDSIYSVTTEERFSTIDFKRDKHLERLPEIKAIESQYFSIIAQLEHLGSSALDNYVTPPAFSFLYRLYAWFPGYGWMLKLVPSFRNQTASYEKWKALKPELNSLINSNRQLLNL